MGRCCQLSTRGCRLDRDLRTAVIIVLTAPVLGGGVTARVRSVTVNCAGAGVGTIPPSQPPAVRRPMITMPMMIRISFRASQTPIELPSTRGC